MPRIKDQAICIREYDWSETSEVVVLLTREHGKIRGLAKGARRTSPSSVARFSGGIDLLTRGEVVAANRLNSELLTVTEWDLQDAYWHLHTNLEAHQLAMYAADLTHMLTADLDPHPGTFDALARFLEALGDASDSPASRGVSAPTNQAERTSRNPLTPALSIATTQTERSSPNPLTPALSPAEPGARGPESIAAPTNQTALLRFQWEVLTDCGFKPELERDVHTGEAFDAPRPSDSDAPRVYAFDAHAGGLTAGDQANGASLRTSSNGPWRVRGETVELLRRLASDPGAALAQTDEASVRRANRLLCVYARATLDRELATMKFVME